MFKADGSFDISDINKIDPLSNLGIESLSDDLLCNILMLETPIRPSNIPYILHYSHISCTDSVRKIDEPTTLDSGITYKHPDVTRIINKLIPEGAKTRRCL